MRAPIVLGLARALRKWTQRTGATAVPGLEAGDLALLTVEQDAPWYPYDQYLRLASASFELLCERDWAKLQEFCARGVASVYASGYQRLLYRGDPERTLAAVSVLWRSCHDFGSAFAQTDARGTTIHVLEYPDVGELDGNVNAGWFLGMARCAGAEVTQVELRRSPWLAQGDEQEIRLEWRLPVSAAGSDEQPGAGASEPGERGRLARVG